MSTRITLALGGRIDRRRFLRFVAAGVSSAAYVRTLMAQEPKAAKEPTSEKKEPTRFQIACMTLVYSQFPFERALNGIRAAGYRYLAWGTYHRDADGKRTPVMPEDAPPTRAAELGRRCRDLGLEPLMMFSGIYPDAPNHLAVFKNRIAQAAAAGIPQVLAFGHTKRGDYSRWIEHFKILGRVARDNHVQIVIKPHGGLTATGKLAAKIVREVADEGVKVNYDSGNLMDDPKIDAAAVIADVQACAAEVRSFCIKDHRHFPKDEDCGPGFGEIDHYKLLHPVAFTGRPMPLCCENIFEPIVPRPSNPEGVDALARRAREFLDVVIRGLQSGQS